MLSPAFIPKQRSTLTSASSFLRIPSRSVAMEFHRFKRESLTPGDAIVDRHAGQVYDPAIMAFRPQRISLASSKTSLSWDSTDFNPESPRSSTTSYASAGTSGSYFPITRPKYSPLNSRRSSFSAQHRLQPNTPRRSAFQRLPPDIFNSVLLQLRHLHEDQNSLSCHTCFLRDLCSLALTSRVWDRAVRVRLYDRIHIVGADSAAHVKKFKMKQGVRLKLLRRTLRERKVLAQYVHELKVPNFQSDRTRKSSETIDLVASIVMACPNLERLVGFYPVYGHKFDRLTYALSTRTKLKEHLWLVGENKDITERSHKQLPPGLMDEEQVGSFLSYHNRWHLLTTLLLHSHEHGILERHLFPGVFRRLPALQCLCVSNFDMDDFDDSTLTALPPLTSLRLQDLEGITFQGLWEYASNPNSHTIQNLSLINLDIKYLSAISKLLLNLKKLDRFTLVQDSSPETEPGELIFPPIIASSSLIFLHWDILLPGPANSNLATSILAHGFPSLRTLRAPSDHNGFLQSVCKPRAQVLIASDKYSSTYRLSQTPDPTKYIRSLISARKAAQDRIDQARKTVQFKVVVEEDGLVSQIYDFNGFVGTIGSHIYYSLKPDVLGKDEAVIDFEDLLDVSKEVSPNDGCTGQWNNHNHAGPKWWSHTERARFQVIDLQRFF